jgi:mRNA interferase MazF
LFGDIHICQFPFTSGLLSKPRPALVLFDLGPDVLIARITSVACAAKLDIQISDWSAAGLAKPSIVRLDRLVTAEKTLLGRRLGCLTPADQSTIRAAWNLHMRL